ncbi:MAG: MBL fold metallo-hydrolase [Phycisphaerae bacterium]|nr:MBL fold metallo-hydrolase [Phycisphaerae bacterium]
MKHNMRIIILVENTASEPDLLAEHGLSFWIEYNGKHILFDTGQSDILINNAKVLGVDLSKTDSIVLSHGHYDHTGGLAAVLDVAKNAKIYLHPDALKQRFSKKDFGAKPNGIFESSVKAIQNREVIWTKGPTQIFPGITVTGQVPRINDFEDVGGAFYTDKEFQTPDELLDDQTLFIETVKGLVVVLGCAHAGVVNILNYISKLSGKKSVYTVLGGMHLLQASTNRIEQTRIALRDFGLEKIGPAHCTGEKAIEKIISAFPDQYFTCKAGTNIDL